MKNLCLTTATQPDVAWRQDKCPRHHHLANHFKLNARSPGLARFSFRKARKSLKVGASAVFAGLMFMQGIATGRAATVNVEPAIITLDATLTPVAGSAAAAYLVSPELMSSAQASAISSQFVDGPQNVMGCIYAGSGNLFPANPMTGSAYPVSGNKIYANGLGATVVIPANFYQASGFPYPPCGFTAFAFPAPLDYSENAKVWLNGGRKSYLFEEIDGSSGSPVAAFPAPNNRSMDEAPGVMQIRLLCPEPGNPLRADLSGVHVSAVLTTGSQAGQTQAEILGLPSGGTSLDDELFVRGGETYTVNTVYTANADEYFNRFTWGATTTGVSAPANATTKTAVDVLSLHCGGGGYCSDGVTPNYFGHITGSANLSGAFTLSPGTRLVADGGLFGNYRYGPPAPYSFNFTSGAYLIKNIMALDASGGNGGENYRVYANMSLQINDPSGVARTEGFTSPCTSAQVVPCQTTDIGDILEMHAGYVEGDIFLKGLADVANCPCLTLLDVAASRVTASGPCTGSASVAFDGQFISGSFHSNYRMALAGLKPASGAPDQSTWNPNVLDLHFNNAPLGVNSHITITDNLFENKNIVAGATLNNDHHYCFASVEFVFINVNPARPFANPTIQGFGNFGTAADFESNPANYDVTFNASGNSTATPSHNEGSVLVCLPAGTYTVTPGIAYPEGTVTVPNITFTVGCMDKIVIPVFPVTETHTNCCDDCTAPYPLSYTNTVYPGYNLLADSLCQGTNHTVNDVLTDVPSETTLVIWNDATQSYDNALTYYNATDAAPDPAGWYDQFGIRSSKTLALGDGYAMYNSSGTPFQLVIRGCEPACPLPCGPTNGCHIVGRHGLGNSTWTNLFSCLPVCGTTVGIWSVAQQNFVSYTYNGAWTPPLPSWGAGIAVSVCVPSNPTTGMTVICPTNKTVVCGTNWSFDLPTAYSCCGTNITIASLGRATNGNCPKVITQTWQINDGCNNSNICSQIVTVVDTTPPTINCSTNKIIPCGAAIVFNTPSVSDSCSGTNVTLTFKTVTNGTPCARVYTRTWTAVDQCNNTNTCSQSITAVDNNPPTINCSTNKTIPCSAVVVFNTPTVSDACSGTNVTLTFITVTNGTPCAWSYTRIWTAVDLCSHTNTCSQTITMTSAPPVVICSSNKTISCTSNLVFDLPTVIASCACTNYSISILGNDVTTNEVGSPCSQINTRTWLITDCCGYSNLCSQVVTVAPPSSYTITLQPGLNLIANQLDNAAGNSAAVLFPNPAGQRDGDELLVWNCSQSYTSYFFDSSSPTGFSDQNGMPIAAPIITLGRGVFYNNQSGVPETVTFTGTPRCPAPPAPLCPCGTFSLVSYELDCFGTYQNITGLAPEEGAQVFRWNGVGFTPYDFTGGAWTPSAPVLNVGEAVFIQVPCPSNSCITLTCSTNKTVPCGTNWSFDAPSNITDNCCTNYNLTFTTVTNSGPCPMVTTRTWTVADTCGHTTNCTQTVTVVDNVPPVLTCSTNKSVNCGSPIVFDPPTVFDACNSYTLTFTTVSSGPCPKTYTRTWTATDACGNAATCSQTITAVDTQAPVIACPTNQIIVAKDKNCMIRIPNIHPKAKDNCTPTSQLVYTQNPVAGTLVSGPCQTVTITVKDLCNNASQCQVQVCGQDKTPPKVTAPKSVTVTNCIVPNLIPYLTATDNCTPANQLKYTQTPPAGTLIAAGGNTVTITVTDQAGNTTTIIISLVNTGTQSFLGSLFNTGVNASKVLLPGAALDAHYTLFPAPAGGPSTYVATLPVWGLPSVYSKWIAPAPDSRFGYPFGFYTYKHQPFDLPPGSDLATASISGRWAADDKGKMYLGTSSTPLSTHTSKDKKWTYFTINSGLLQTANMLRFEVENTTSLFSRPTGLRVEFTNALVNCYTCTPPAMLVITPNLSRPVSGTAVFTANVGGTPVLTYQWYRNGSPLANGGHYAGVTTPTLTITPLAYADAGTYHVVVANPCGTKASKRSKLTVTKHWWDWPWAAWDVAQIDNPLLATYGPDLVLVSTNDIGISAGNTADFDLPSLGGQIANVMHVPALDGDTLIQLPQVGSNVVNSYTLLMDVYRPAGSTGTNTLFNIGSSGQDGVRILWAEDDRNIVSGSVGGQAFNLIATTPMPTGTWSRVAIVVDNPQDNPLEDASLTLYVNGEDAGGLTFTGTPHVPVLPGLTLDWSAGNPATLFTSPAGTSGETYVAGVQFHATAMTPEMIAGFGDPDSGLMPANDTSVGIEPVLSATQANGQFNLTWTGSSYVLQETDNLISGVWVDSGIAFDETEVNGNVQTTAHANPATEGPMKFYRLIYTP